MAKQNLILPQQKSFFFLPSIKQEEIDKKINDWLKECVLKGNHPSPSGPSVTQNNDGALFIVYMYATTIEK